MRSCVFEYQIDVAYARQSLEAVALSEGEAQWLRPTLECPAMLERRWLSTTGVDRSTSAPISTAATEFAS